MGESKKTIGKYYGSAVMGPRGQVVIPVEARRELGIETGTKLLVFNRGGGKGLLLIKVEAVEDLINTMGQRLDEFNRLLKEVEEMNQEDGSNKS